MISTPRLQITEWKLEDAKEFFDLTQDDGFNLFPITIYRQTSIESAGSWIRENSRGKMAVRDRQSGKLIGMGGLSAWKFQDEELVDITYRLRQSVWGQGYGIELAKALVDYGFKVLKLKEVTATITPDNLPSKRIAEKLGFKFDQKILLKGVATYLYRLMN